MPRKGPSAADGRLIEELATFDVSVTATQLERWRRQGWIPRNNTRSLGRGKGSTSAIGDGVIDLVAAIASVSRSGRRGWDIVAEVFMFHGGPLAPTGRPHPSPPEPAVRAALRDVLRHRLALADATSHELDDVDAAYTSAKQMSERLPAWHPYLLEDLHAELAGRYTPSRHDEEKSARGGLEQLLVAAVHPDEVTEARIILEAFRDLGLGPATEVADMIDRVAADTTYSEELTRRLAGLMPTSGRLQTALDSASFAEIDRARLLAMGISGLNAFGTLMSFTHFDDPALVAMRNALGYFSISAMPFVTNPRQIVPLLASLLATPGAIAVAEDRLAAAAEAATADSAEFPGETLVARHIAVLKQRAAHAELTTSGTTS